MPDDFNREGRGIENLAGLEGLPAAAATVFIGVPGHKTGSGGPARVMVVV